MSFSLTGITSSPGSAVIRFAADVREAREVAKSDRPPLRLAWPQDQAERTCVLDFEPGDARIFKLRQEKN